MNTIAPSLTVAEFGRRYAGERVELVDGLVEYLPMPGGEHGELNVTLILLLGGFIRQHRLGLVVSHDTFIQVRESPPRVRGADLAFWREERRPPLPTPTGVIDSPPDLVVEVRSPSDRHGAVLAKVAEYLTAGVRVVVVLDPRLEAATVFREEESVQTFANGDTFTLPDVLPGFAVPVSAFFAS